MATGLFQKLPPELAGNILDSIEFPVTLEKAREQRLELMDERKSFGYHADDLIESKRFDVSLLFPRYNRPKADMPLAL